MPASITSTALTSPMTRFSLDRPADGMPKRPPAFGSSMPEPFRVLLISGSLRRMSTNTAVLRTAQAVAPKGVEAILYDGVRMLPHFDPDLDGELLDPAVAALRAAIRHADALLFSTPEYAGALPGS